MGPESRVPGLHESRVPRLPDSRQDLIRVPSISNRGSDRVPVLDNKNNQESILQKVVEQFRPEEKDGDSGIDSNSHTSATSEPKVNEEKETTTKTKRKNKKKKGSNSNSSGSISN